MLRFAAGVRDMTDGGKIAMWGPNQADCLYDDCDEPFEKDAADLSMCSMEAVDKV